MYYTVYKTTNLKNDKIYVGIHKTDNLNDDYIGSGKILKKAIEKYGIENFKKEILFVFDNPDEMFAKESLLVDNEFVSRKDTYNVKLGGSGGWDYVFNNGLSLNWSYVHQHENFHIWNEKSRQQCYIKVKWLRENDEEWVRNIKDKMREAALKNPSMLNKKHSIETKLKISNKLKISSKGEKNSQFGTCWINNGLKILKIHKNDIDKYILIGYKKGRKIK